MTEDRLGIDYAAQLAGIERSMAETRKFVAEQNKLSEETLKLGAEKIKLNEEALKMARDRSLAPLALFSGLVGGALAATIAHFLR